jgi:hypothetical protein
MGKSLVIVNKDGGVNMHEIFKLSFLLLLSALCIVAALAINETVQEILKKCIKKDCILGYLIYTIISIALIIVVVYIACKCYPDLFDHIDLSPKSRYY